MGRKQKYEEVKNYWVYSIQVPSNGKYYIGVSKIPCCKRWNKSTYKNTVLKEYLQEWQDMEKKVLIDGLTKGQSYQYEDNIIRALQMNNLCLNDKRSGLIEVSDVNTYLKEWYEDNKKQVLEYQKQYQLENKEKINQRRRQRYQNDAEFREHEKQRAKQNRLKKKIEKQQLNLFS